MFQNLKVDIVYYKTNTDFEMEFNLCGCCRMRLLTDKVPDSKSAVRSLARAVSRSRIIIVTGALFGEEGVIKLVAKAIDSKLRAVNNKAYGISGDEAIEILDGATPLVTSEGYFGGCIIERGPQTMILLTENKSIRKTVMQTLIHPYIEQLCAIGLNAKASAAKGVIGAESEDATLNALAGEYETVASELFTEEEDISQQQKEVDTEILEGAESPLLVEEDETSGEEQPIVLDEEYEKIAEALYTVSDNDKDADSTENNELITDEESDLIIDEADDDNEEITLEEEYEKIADALFTEVDDITEQEEEIDEEIAEGKDIPLVMEEETEDQDPMNLDDEYEQFAVTLYTESNTEADLNRDPDEVSETTEAEAEALSTSGFLYENEEDESKAFDSEYEERFNRNIHSMKVLDVSIWMLIAVILLVLAILCYCIFFVPTQSGENITEYIRDTFNTLFGK